jgi:tetratricopeptide (TPR) repeat protein
VQPLELPRDVVPEVGELPEGSCLTPARNPRFVGRAADLLRIATTLRAGRVALVTGEDGIGKTQLALEFVHRYGRLFEGGVFWLSFSVPDQVPAQVAACGDVGLRGDYARLTLDQQVQLVSAAWQSPTPRLLVFDECEHPGALREWLPTQGGAHVLVTTRRLLWDGQPPGAIQELGPLGREDAAALLRRFRPDLHAATPALRFLAGELGDVPLALRLAGGFLRCQRDEIAIESMLGLLRARDVLERAAALVPQVEEPAEAPGRPLFGRRAAPQAPPVARTFALATQSLTRGGPAGARALAVLVRAAHFAPGEPVPREALIGPDGDEDALAELVELALLEADGEGWLRLHRLLADYVRRSWHDPDARGAAEEAMIEWARAAGQSGDPSQRLAAAPHLETVTTEALRRAQDERSAALAFELGSSLWAAGDLTAARPYLQRAVDIREATLGPSDARTIDSLANLGLLLQAQGDLSGARAALERALELSRRWLGPDHPDTLAILANLAWTLRYEGDLAGALTHLQRALAAAERTFGADHAETAASLDRLALLLREQGNAVAARPYLERALRIRVESLGDDHPTLLPGLVDLGMLLLSLGDPAEARPYLRQALECAEEVLGPDHVDTALALDGVAALHQAEGELVRARAYLERALAIRERALGADDPLTGASLDRLGVLLHQVGDLEAARPLLERSLVISQRAVGPYDPQTATSLSSLGVLLLEQGDLFGAQPKLERALAIREQALGADHPDTATSLENLAALMTAVGDLPTVRTHLERALEIREELLGPDHPETARSLHRAGRLLRDLGDLAAARQLFERAVAIRELALGPDHPDTLASMTDLDRVTRDLGLHRGWPKYEPPPLEEPFEPPR